MKKFINLLKQPEFHVLLFCISFTLLCLPFLIFPANNEPVNMFDKNMFYYFFIAWGSLIVLLFLIARSLREDTDGKTGHEEGCDTDV